MRNVVVIGSQWGDEGKGKIVFIRAFTGVIGFSLGGLIAAHFSSTRKHYAIRTVLFGTIFNRTEEQQKNAAERFIQVKETYLNASHQLDRWFNKEFLDANADILEKITDEDCRLLGFSELWCRPEWMICSALPVPPPAVRPSVKQDDSQRMEDDLTHKLSDIIKTNERYRQQKEKELVSGEESKYSIDLQNYLQYHRLV